MALTKPVHKPRKKSSTSHKPQTLLTFLAQACVNPPHTLAQNPKPHVGVSENSTLKNRILIIQTPKKGTPNFRKFYVNPAAELERCRAPWCRRILRGIRWFKEFTKTQTPGK